MDERIAKIESLVAETLNEESAQTKVCSAISNKFMHHSHISNRADLELSMPGFMQYR